MSILSHFSFYKLFNVFLRISGIGSKFLVFTLLSKTLTVKNFGDYSLITSLITIMIFVLGVDFYNFSIRDILTTKEDNIIQDKVVSSFLFYCLIYLVFAIVAGFVFQEITYTKNIIFYTIFLCITEHLSQEIYRLLVGFKKVLLANILLFIRTMGWALFIFYFSYANIPFNTNDVLALWLTSNLITIVYVFFYALFKRWNSINNISVSFQWIKKGVSVCYLFFISTVFLKLIEYANRFIVDFFLGEELAGIFTFYSSIAILITVYINTIVISFELPALIEATNTDNVNQLYKKFKRSLLVQTIVIATGLLIIIRPLLYWQDKEEFKEYLPLLFFMIIGVGLMNYSLAYHFKLYLKHLDKILAKIMVVSGTISIIISLFLTKYFGVYGSALGFAISGIILYILRYRWAKNVTL